VRYLLDSDVCIAIIRGKTRAVPKAFESHSAGEAGISVITYLELMTGAHKSNRHHEAVDLLRRFTQFIPVQPLTRDVAPNYARIRAALERSGRKIGPHDLLIAAHALTLDLIVVTNNTREFSRVPGLRVENWLE
jgi:tRNA(fMet)-specific endonuclease VapC